LSIILSNRLYVPADLIEEWQKDEFVYELERGMDPITKELQYAVIKTFKDFPRGYVGFHRGNLGKLRKIFPGEFDDQTVLRPHEYDLQFKWTLYPEQHQVAETWKKHGYGICKCPTGYGKSVLGISLICDLGQRTMILAHQVNLLEQWEDMIRQSTNVNELEKELEEPLIGIRNNKNENDFPMITLSTFQSFMSTKGKKKCKAMRDDYGLVIVDEAHRSPAYCFSQVFAQFNPKYRCGFTATDKRKDGLECVMFDIVGPVTAEGKTQTIPCEVSIERTGTEVKSHQWWTWTKMISSLSKNDDRNELILSI